MNRGWISLHRKTIDSRVFKNEGLFKVWIWCLCRANYEKSWVSVVVGKGQTEVELDRGQFIFGRKTAAASLNMIESTVWKRMKKLEKMENLNIKSNSHYSIVSVINYDSYQDVLKKGDSDSNSQVTAGEQPGNTDNNSNNPNNPKKHTHMTDPDYSRFYNSYPKHKARLDGFKAWKSKDVQLCLPPIDELLDVLEKQKKTEESWSRDNGEFIPLPATWLRGHKWTDELQLTEAEKYQQLLEQREKEKQNGSL